jgi:hypothetical protein
VTAIPEIENDDMVDWQITAKTIYCDSFQDEVTIIVKKDWSAQCTGYSGLSKASGVAGRTAKGRCEGLDCARIVQYRDFLKQEEAQKLRDDK